MKLLRFDCSACGGYPELDEAGCPYTCYRCHDTGYEAYELPSRVFDGHRDAAEEARMLALLGGGTAVVGRVDDGWQIVDFEKE